MKYAKTALIIFGLSVSLISCRDDTEANTDGDMEQRDSEVETVTDEG